MLTEGEGKTVVGDTRILGYGMDMNGQKISKDMGTRVDEIGTRSPGVVSDQKP